MSKESGNKLEWVRSLNVGFFVCDCRYKHLKITKIDREFGPPHVKWLKNIIFHDWVSLKISWKLDGLYNRWFTWRGKLELVDKDLVLEDGSGCSAMSCCSPADHEWKHH